MSTFAVSDVAASRAPLPVATLEDALRARLQSGFEAAGASLGGLVMAPVHPFIAAVDLSFREHYPLVLSPDDVWLCIAQGFAMHLDLHAEALRAHFVRHAGKVKLEVRRDQFVKGSPANDWPGSFAELSDRVAAHVGKARDLVVADFSTTGPIERAASEVVLLAAMRHYFDYGMVSMCGIPSVTLLGTVADWRSIRARAAVLAEHDLGWWTGALLPLLDEIVRAKEGRPDVALWRSFYKEKSASGGPYVTGWINTLFPYVVDNRGVAKTNEAALRWAEGMGGPFGGGPRPDAFLTGLSIAPLEWSCRGTTYPMELVAGFVAASQDAASLAVRPAIGWAVRDAAP